MTGPLVVIVGATASGKSALALQLAGQCNGEIIAADSWTVYKGFDVGTAKPTDRDRQTVPHHLLDVADTQDGFSAVIFQRLANAAIADITARGKLPFLVGGTGLYIDSVIFKYSFLPPANPDQRQTLNAMTLAEVVAVAQARQLDTTGLDLGNKRRVIRLIENDGLRPTKQAVRPNTLILGLPTDQTQLRDKVIQRVDAMLAAGLEAEVKQLADTYGWEAEAMKGVGYQQWRDYFLGTQNLAQTRLKIIKATLDLAKRQRTWFKRNNSIHWLNNSDKYAEAAAILTTFLNKN